MISKKINENLSYVTTSYKDIFTTVYLIKTDKGYMLFDTASFDHDVDETIKPMLDELNVTKDDLKYVFISHAHLDHMGGLKRLLEVYPDVTVITKNEDLKNKHPEHNFIIPEENRTFLDALRVIFIPGHSSCSEAIYDTRDNSLITGDCLQLYGIFGSGNWACNISLPKKHFDALEKLEKMEISAIYTAHDYHPMGQFFVGKDKVKEAIENCKEPLVKIMNMITDFPALSNEEIAEKYNAPKTLPKLGSHVVERLRTLI